MYTDAIAPDILERVMMMDTMVVSYACRALCDTFSALEEARHLRAKQYELIAELSERKKKLQFRQDVMFSMKEATKATMDKLFQDYIQTKNDCSAEIEKLPVRSGIKYELLKDTISEASERWRTYKDQRWANVCIAQERARSEYLEAKRCYFEAYNKLDMIKSRISELVAEKDEQTDEFLELLERELGSSLNNANVKVDANGAVNVYYGEQSQHGHIVIKDGMVTYNRPPGNSHGVQNFLSNQRRGGEYHRYHATKYSFGYSQLALQTA